VTDVLHILTSDTRLTTAGYARSVDLRLLVDNAPQSVTMAARFRSVLTKLFPGHKQKEATHASNSIKKHYPNQILHESSY